MKKNISSTDDIYNYIAEKVTEYFSENLDLEENDLLKLYLGVMVILLNTFKILLVCFVATFFGICKEVLLLMVIFGSVRVSAAGIHLKTNISCTIACLIAYLGCTYTALKFTVSIEVAFFMSIFSLVLLYRYSPADTKNRPILGGERRQKLKLKTTKTAIYIIFINLLIGNKLIFNLTMYAFFIQVICILPITYKLLNESYNNYIEYE